MSISQENMNLFEAYQGQKLSEEAQQRFEKRLVQDKDLAREYDEYQRDLKLARALSAGDEMRAIMEAQRGDEGRKRGKTKRRYLVPLTMAAAIALFFYILSPEGPVNSQELFTTYFEPFPDIATDRSTAARVESEALSAYGDGDYAKAISLFEKITDKSDAVLFYQSVTLLGLRNAQEAIRTIDAMSASSDLYDFSHWYKALAFILMEQHDSARVYLQKVPLESINKPSADLLSKELN